MTDARKQAEEALRVYDHECKARPDCVTCTPRLGMALRSLLAALPDEEDLSPLRESAIGYIALVNQPPAPQPALTLTRDEAVAAGLPIHPEAVGVKVYSGARVSQPDAVREAAERLLTLLYLYPNYRVDSRGPSGLVVDALDVLAPDLADRLREGEAPQDLLIALGAAKGPK